MNCEPVLVFWARCSEYDGAMADIKIGSTSDGNAYDQLGQIAWIEHRAIF